MQGYQSYIKNIYEVPADQSDIELAKQIINLENNEDSGVLDSCRSIHKSHRPRSNTPFSFNKQSDAYFCPTDKLENSVCEENQNNKASEMGFPIDNDADFRDQLCHTNKNKRSRNILSTFNIDYDEDEETIMNQNFTMNNALPNESQKCYVVILSSKSDSITNLLKDATITNYFSRYVLGFAFCTNKSVEKLRSDASVLFLEEDKYYFTASVQLNVPNHMFFMMNYRNTILNNTLFDNFVMRLLPFKYIYKFFYSYYRYKFTGRNVEIYMIDTSVNENFEDIKGRVINVCKNGKCGNVGFDDVTKPHQTTNHCLRHGTNVADLIVGRVNGFAKDGRIKVLNVFDCEGKSKLSSIISALDTIIPREKSSLLNMSISGPQSEIFSHVLSKLPKNMILIAAAGNNSDLSCNYSPGSSMDVINVGSLDIHSKISKFSNFSSCVRIYSIGERIKINKEINGTSYSAALVAGSAAVYLEVNPYAKIADVWKFLAENADLVDGNYLAQKIPVLADKNLTSMLLKRDGEFYWGVFVIIIYIAFFIFASFIAWLALRHKRESGLRI